MTGVGFGFLIIGVTGFVIRGAGIGGHLTMGVGLFGLVGAILTLLLISSSYTTALQDRIIKLEMRLRCAALLTPQQAVVWRLEKPQLVALRFAPTESSLASPSGRTAST